VWNQRLIYKDTPTRSHVMTANHLDSRYSEAPGSVCGCSWHCSCRRISVVPVNCQKRRTRSDLRWSDIRVAECRVHAVNIHVQSLMLCSGPPRETWRFCPNFDSCAFFVKRYCIQVTPLAIHGMQWRQWIWTYLWSDIDDAILCVRQIVYKNKNGGY